MRKLNLKIGAAVLGATAMMMAQSVYGNLTINDSGVVGTMADGEPASVADEVLYANKLISMAANSTDTVNFGGSIGSKNFTTGQENGVLAHDPVSAVGAFQTISGNNDGNGPYVVNVPAGYEYVLAKYDGPNAGDVLWYLGGKAATLPTFSYSLWSNGHSTDSYGISHFTVFNAVPEPTTMIAGALLLLPFGASTLRVLRNRKA
jgi:hypothetical protein